MALRKRGGIWHVDMVHEGRRVRESTKTGDRKLAEVRQAEILAGLFRGTHVPSAGAGTSYTVGKAFDRAFEGAWLTEARENTKRSALDNFRGLTVAGWLTPSTPVGSLDRHALEKLQRDLVDSGLSNGTVNRRMWVVRAILEQAHKDGALKAMPDVPKNRRESSGRREYLTREDEARVLEFCLGNARYATMRDLLVVLLDTGMRLSEATGLRRGDVDFTLGVVRVGADRDKTHAGRAVPMTTRVREVLTRRLADAATTAVFEAPEGTGPKYWMFHADKRWAEIRKGVGLPESVVMHSTRHTLGTRLFEAGVDLRTAMEYMGHKTPTMTLRYAKAVAGQLKDAASRIERFGMAAAAQTPARDPVDA